MFKNIPNKLISKYEMPKNCSIFDILEEQNRKQSETGDPISSLELKVNTRVMITAIIGISDRLIMK